MAQGARITGSFKEAFDSINAEVQRVHQKLVRNVYDELFPRSRVFSGYYKSNHRILQNKNSTAQLIPAKRPSDVQFLSLIKNVEVTKATEKAKIEKIKPFTTTIIGTAVPYADALEARDGTYQKAAAIGLALVDVNKQ